MRSFIEDYLHNPSAAIAKASESMKGTWHDAINEEDIYSQISSPEFRLYQELL